MKNLIFVCSKYRGDVEQNLLNAKKYCKFVVSNDHVPIAPHLLFPQFLNDKIQNERNLDISMGLEIISRCDELWIFGQEFSSDMIKEIRHAKQVGVKIKQFTTDCEEVEIDGHD